MPALNVNNLALKQKYLERSKIGIPLGEGTICQQEVVGLYNKRVGFCGILPVRLENPTINVVKSVSGNIHFQGMQYCGRNWLCPKCSFKIMKSRTGEIAKQFKKYRAQGEKIFFYTFTLQHNRWQTLKDLLDILLGAYKYARSHRRYRQYVGKTRFIRTIEIKYGSNGWHPHIHCAFVSKDEDTGNDIFQELYENYLRKKGLLVNEFTVNGKEWDGTVEELSEYLLKWELERELTGGNDKTGTGGLTFFEMVKFYHEYIKQVEEYIEATKGHKQYHFTGNFFDKAQKTDEEIVQEHEETKEVLFEIPKEEYGKMYYHNLTRRFIKWIKEKDPDYDKIKRTLENKGINTDWLKVPG